MRPDPADPAPALSEVIAREAERHDAEGSFPSGAFAELTRRGLIAAPPVAPEEIRALLRLLAEIGRGDLSVARIYEGHVNARLLIARHGTPEQRARAAGLGRGAGGARLLGVWNTDAPGDPLRLEGGRLRGRKAFASGIDGLAEAIVTVEEPEGRRMLLVPVAAAGVDRSWWRPLGMRASGSHVADFTGVAVEPHWFLGAPGAYLERPWFSAGAIRFLAAQVGGAHAVLDIARAHLAGADRAAHPRQAARLARMGVAVETGYLWLDRAAASWRAAAARSVPSAERELMATADGARGAVEAAALAVLAEAEKAIGAAGMIAPHPFERRMRDLRVYLRQPNPDGAEAAFGAAIAAGDWAAGSAS